MLSSLEEEENRNLIGPNPCTPIQQLGGWNKAGAWLQEFPTSPDGTDWGMWGDKPEEQWDGVYFTALLEHRCRLLQSIYGL